MKKNSQFLPVKGVHDCVNAGNERRRDPGGNLTHAKQRIVPALTKVAWVPDFHDHALEAELTGDFFEAVFEYQAADAPANAHDSDPERGTG